MGIDDKELSLGLKWEPSVILEQTSSRVTLFENLKLLESHFENKTCICSSKLLYLLLNI